MSDRPEIIKSFRIYENGTNKFYGTSTVQLPSMEALVTELKGAGIMGSYETPNVGHYGPLTTTINFWTATEEIKSWYSGQYKMLDIRVAEQEHDEKTGEKTVAAIKYLVGGTVKKNDLGKVEGSSTADGSIDIATTLFAIYKNGKELQYFDKLNYVYRVNGVDIIAAEKAALGG